jgi:hypothetical protein
MALLYTYGVSPYVSKRWSDVQDLLNQLQDNNANLIYANHVRDAVYTLWERVEEVAIIAASASAISPYFLNPNPTTIEVGGITLSTTFSTQQTVQQMFDRMLYPYVEPILRLGAFKYFPLANKEYGQNPNSTLYWSVTKSSNSIQAITVVGQSILANGGNQASTKTITGSYSTIGASTTNSFQMTVNDGVTNYTISTEYQWMNRLYWGSLVLSGIDNPDFTLDSGLLATVTMNSATILGLDNSKLFKGGGNDYTIDTIETFDMPATEFGSGGYLVYAWSSHIPYATVPKFKVNGVRSTAFSNIKNGWNFVNVYGVTSSYEVWISNTTQYSQLDVEIKFGPST